MSFRIAIVDDDAQQLAAIAQLTDTVTKSCQCHCVIDCFHSALELNDGVYDAYLLDISMPGTDGIRIAERIRKSGSMCSIIFISSHDMMVFEALRVEPLRFVRKGRLLTDGPEAIRAMCDKLVQDSAMLTLVVGDQPFCVPMHRILYIESNNKLRTVVLPEARYEVRTTMCELENRLKPHGFFRIHRGYLVNLRAVYTIQEGRVVLQSGKVLPLSRQQEAEAKRQLKRRMIR